MSSTKGERLHFGKIKPIGFIIPLTHIAIWVAAIGLKTVWQLWFHGLAVAFIWLVAMLLAFFVFFGLGDKYSLAAWLYRTLDHGLWGWLRKSREQATNDAGRGMPFFGKIDISWPGIAIKRLGGWAIEAFRPEGSNEIFGLGRDKWNKTLTVGAWVKGPALTNAGPRLTAHFRAGMPRVLKDLEFVSDNPVLLTFLLQSFKGDDSTPEEMVEAAQEFRNRKGATPKIPEFMRKYLFKNNKDGLTHRVCVMVTIKTGRLPRNKEKRQERFKAVFEEATAFLKVIAGDGPNTSPLGLAGYRILDYNDMILLARSAVDPFYGRHKLMNRRLPRASDGLLPNKMRLPKFANFKAIKHAIIGESFHRARHIEGVDADGVPFNLLEGLQNMPFTKNMVIVMRMLPNKDARNYTEMASGEQQDNIARRLRRSRVKARHVVEADRATGQEMDVALNDGRVVFDLYLNLFGRDMDELEAADDEVDRITSRSVLDLEPLLKIHWKGLNAALPLSRGLEQQSPIPKWLNVLYNPHN